MVHREWLNSRKYEWGSLEVSSEKVSKIGGRADLRPFMFWDGEGVTHDGDSRQSYVLFGCSEVEPIIKERLTTLDCLRYMMQVKRKYPNHIHVGFAFNYDVNMILRSLTPVQFARLAEHGYLKYLNYTIEHVPSKWFRVTETDPEGKRLTIKIADIFGFFQTSFIKAVESYLPDSQTVEDSNIISAGKAARKDFAYSDIDTIKEYWQAEARVGVELAEKLRSMLLSVDIKVGQWHGPGAIANSIYNKHHISLHKGDTPPEVKRAARYAYAGGRFELFRLGAHGDDSTPVYSADINSAYPNAIAKLPSLSEGFWQYTDKPTLESVVEFGVYHVKLIKPETVLPGPLFHRSKNGEISFPWILDGWYWSPEIKQLKGIEGVQILEGWEYIGWHTRPFQFVQHMYDQRRELKSQGNGAEKALKLALNSLYGKLAQRSGWKRTGDAPKWHELSWAGWITSYARAMLYDVLKRIPPEHLIGVETDGIYTTYNPALLGIENSKELGGWEVTSYQRMLYLQNGVYSLQDYKGDWTTKYRGLDKGSVTPESMADILHGTNATEEWPELIGPTTRFTGYRAALIRQKNEGGVVLKYHRQWERTERRISLGNSGKRVHRAKNCSACKNNSNGYTMPHQLTIRSRAIIQPKSHMHDIPWEQESPVANWREQLEYEGDLHVYR